MILTVKCPGRGNGFNTEFEVNAIHKMLFPTT